MEIPLVTRARAHRERTAILSADGRFTYEKLLDASARIAAPLLGTKADLGEERVAFLVPGGFSYVAIQWAVWRAGGVAVPLSPSHPPPELDYVIADSGARTIVGDPRFEERLHPIVAARGLRWIPTDALAGGPALESPPPIDRSRRAMILYTSGTTSRPKGVVSTHRNLEARIETLVGAWEWRADDRILHVLPLHHVHGIVNALCCALWSGAACEMLDGFDAEEVWRRLAAGETTLFMAVPTIYAKLAAAWEEAPPERRRTLSAACGGMRLLVSGSAALPVELSERWREIGGQTLLERYGLTETGMVLSDPLRG